MGPSLTSSARDPQGHLHDQHSQVDAIAPTEDDTAAGALPNQETYAELCVFFGAQWAAHILRLGGVSSEASRSIHRTS